MHKGRSTATRDNININGGGIAQGIRHGYYGELCSCSVISGFCSG